MHNMNSEKKLIALVDDCNTNLYVGKTILEDEYVVATAPSAEKLFLFLEKNTPALILLDVEMPEMDGFEAKNFAVMKFRHTVKKEKKTTQDTKKPKKENGN